MKAALLMCIVFAGPGLAQTTTDAGQPTATSHLNLLEDGQVTIDISAVGPLESIIWIKVATSVLPLGAVLTLSNPGTAWQQSLVAFGARSDVSTLGYQLAVPRGTAKTSLTLQVQIGQPDSAFLRPATSNEVLGITVLPAR